MGRLLELLLVLNVATGAQASHSADSETLIDTMSLVQLSGPPAAVDKTSTWFSKLGNLIKSVQHKAPAADTKTQGYSSAAELRVLSGTAHPRDEAKERPVIVAEEEPAIQAETQPLMKEVETEAAELANKKAEEAAPRAAAELASKRAEEAAPRAEPVQQVTAKEVEARKAVEEEKMRLVQSTQHAAEQLAVLKVERQRTLQRERDRAQEAAAAAGLAAEQEKQRLQELHDKLVKEMRAKIVAEAEAKVKQQMKEKRMARQAELSQKRAEEKARQEQQAVLREQQKQLALKQEGQRKLDLVKEKAERKQSYLIAQQLKLEAEKEAAQKRKAAADRRAEYELTQAERAKRREEDQARRRQAASDITEVPTENDNIISLRLLDGLSREVELRVARDARLRAVMNVACQRFGLDRAHTMFTFNDKRVGSLDTPNSAGIEHGDVLMAVEVQDEVEDVAPQQAPASAASQAAQTAAQPPAKIPEKPAAAAQPASGQGPSSSTSRSSSSPKNMTEANTALVKAYRIAKDGIVDTLHQINSDVVDWLNKMDQRVSSELMAIVKKSELDKKLPKTAMKAFVEGKVASARSDLWKYVEDCREEVKTSMGKGPQEDTAASKKHELELTEKMAYKVQNWMMDAEKSLPRDVNSWLLQFKAAPH